MRRLGRARARRWAASGICLGVVVVLAGCASDLLREGGLYRHRRLGYVISAPSGAQAYWRRIGLKDADLAFRGGEGELISLASRCGHSPVPARILARHLRIGVPEHRVRAEGEVEVDGHAAWMQIFDARAQGVTVRAKTVTVVLDGCSYDWVLVARHGFEAAEPGFDAWWRSFRPPPRTTAEGAP